jgi:hypothetical protein
MAEFALVAPIFFLLVFSVIELALLMGGQNGLVASARELARYAAPYRVATNADATAVCNNKGNPDHGLTQQIEAFMSRTMPGYIPANLVARTVTYTWGSNPGTPTTYYVQLEIHIEYGFPLHVPLVGNLLDAFDGSSDGKFRLDATERMRIENPALTTTSATPVTCSV